MTTAENNPGWTKLCGFLLFVSVMLLVFPVVFVSMWIFDAIDFSWKYHLVGPLWFSAVSFAGSVLIAYVLVVKENKESK